MSGTVAVPDGAPNAHCSVENGNLTLDSSPGCQVGPSRRTTSTLVEENGRGVIGILAYPVVLALVPALIRRRRWPRIAAAILMAPLGLLVFSVGLFYWPAIALMVVAAAAPTR